MNKSNCKDINVICSEQEERLVFKLFKMLVNMTEGTREEMIQYQNELFLSFKLNDPGNGIDI